MLKQRVISAAILAPPGIAAIFLLPKAGFELLIALVLTLGIWEWSRLAGIRVPSKRLAFTFLICLSAQAILYYLPHQTIILTGCLWWLAAMVWLAIPKFRPDNSALSMLIKSLAAVLAIVPAYAALNWLRSSELESKIILILFFIIWAADIGAYFTGKSLGKNKLAPQISPGKTWEGLLGGLFSAALIAFLAYQLVPMNNLSANHFILLAAVTALFSVEGDLIISLFKRQESLKDTSQLIPGHGGILDRFDSLLSASPIFATGLIWLS